MSKKSQQSQNYLEKLPEQSAKNTANVLVSECNQSKDINELRQDIGENISLSPVQSGKSDYSKYKLLFCLLLGIVILLLSIFLFSTIYGGSEKISSPIPKNKKTPKNSQETKTDVQIKLDNQQIAPVQPVQQQISDLKTQTQKKPQIKIEVPQNSVDKKSDAKKESKTQKDSNKGIRKQKEQEKKQEPPIQQKPQKQKEQQSVFIKQQEQTVKTQEEQQKKTPTNFSVRQRLRGMNLKIDEKVDCYEFSASIENVIAKSGISTTYRNEFEEWVGIKQSEYARAIRLMEVVHNINFKGEFVFDHFNFYPSAQAKYQALLKVLEEEKSFYDQKYQISKYIHDQIGICVYVPSYNNAQNRLYLRNLDSIFQQEYQNYHVVYVNDASTDGTGDYVKAYMNENGIPAEKYAVIDNDKNKEDCGNFYMVVRDYCSDGQIMVFLDGQDSLIGRQVFSLLNAVYQKQKVALTYGQYLNVQGNKVHSGSSRLFPSKYLEDGNFRQLRSFYTSHLKTAYVDLLKLIRKQDLQDKDGSYFEYGADIAIMTPAIELAGTRVKFLSELNYENRFDSGFHQPHDLLRAVQNEVFQKEPLQSIQDMSFADKPITAHYE